MKNSELRMLLAKYKGLAKRPKGSHAAKVRQEMAGIERRYLHETGRTLKSDLPSRERG